MEELRDIVTPAIAWWDAWAQPGYWLAVGLVVLSLLCIWRLRSRPLACARRAALTHLRSLDRLNASQGNAVLEWFFVRAQVGERMKDRDVWRRQLIALGAPPELANYLAFHYKSANVIAPEALVQKLRIFVRQVKV